MSLYCAFVADMLDGQLAHLDPIEAYYDQVPRTAARAESLGPFTLFVGSGPGWQYYARPTLGMNVFSPQDVERVRERQRALAVPEAFEWVAEVTPGLTAVAGLAGLSVREHPLLVPRDSRAALSDRACRREGSAHHAGG